MYFIDQKIKLITQMQKIKKNYFLRPNFIRELDFCFTKVFDIGFGFSISVCIFFAGCSGMSD